MEKLEEIINLIDTKFKTNYPKDYSYKFIPCFKDNLEDFLRKENLKDIKSFIIELDFQKPEHSVITYIKLRFYLFTNKLYTNVLISAEDNSAVYVIERKDHLIYKDFKKTEISENKKLNIYFHGFHEADVIEFEDYEEALNLQRQITEWREGK